MNFKTLTLVLALGLPFAIAGCAEDIDDIPCIGEEDGTECDPATTEGDGVCIDENCVECNSSAEAGAMCIFD